MTRTITLATFNCENLFSRPAIFEQSDERSHELLHTVDLLKAELKKPVFDKGEIARLTEALKGFATINDIRGKAASAKGAKDWLGYVSLDKTTFADAAVDNVARVIADTGADIVCLIEVEDRLSLKGFHNDILYRGFLKKQKKDPYTQFVCIQGNDGRGINVALMSRLPVSWIKSHADEKTKKNTPLFSRDCLEVNLALPGGKPLHLLLNHFKSMGYSSPDDPQGNKRRLVQSTRVGGLLDSHDLSSGYVVVAGDFNSPATSPSLEPVLGKPGLYNVNEELAAAERGTYRTGKDQLDYLVVSDALKKKIASVRIERRGIFTAKGEHYPTVTSRRTEASDHAAVVATFEMPE